MGSAAGTLFGRHAELDQLSGAIVEARAGRPGVHLVSGPPGIGKTSLVSAATRCRPGGRLDDGAVAVVSIRCSEFDAAPDEPLSRLSDLVGRRVGRVGNRTDPGTDSGGGLTTDPDAARSAERQAAGALATEVLASVDRPTVLIVDDLHWAGRPVLDVVELLAVEIADGNDRPLLVVLVSRPLPPDSDAAARLDRLERDTLLRRLDLGPIDEAADADLVRSRVPGATMAAINYVRRSAEGNPLRTLATLTYLDRRGVTETLSATDERAWAAHVPETLTLDPVATWLDDLPDNTTTTCGLLAAVGPEIGLADAAAAVGATSLDAVDRLQVTLDDAVAHRILDTDGDWYWFHHELYRDMLYGALSPEHRRQAHAALATAALARGDDPAATVLAGRHLLAAGPELELADAGAAALAAAARAAFEAKAWDEAGRFFEAHLARSAVDAGDRARFDLLVEVGLAHYFNAEHAAATERLTEALALSESLGDDARAKALVPLMRIRTTARSSALHEPADIPALGSFLAEATDPAPLAQVLQVRADSLLTAGLIERGEADGRRSLELAVEAGDLSTAAFAGQSLGYAASLRAAPDEAIGHLTEARRRAIACDDWFARDSIETRMACARLVGGAIEGADEHALAAQWTAKANHDVKNLGLANAVLATTSYLRGDFLMARQLAEQAASQGRRAEYAPMQLFVAPTVVLANLVTADRAGAQAVLDEGGAPLPIIDAALRWLVEGEVSAEADDLPTGVLLDPAIGASAAAAIATGPAPRSSGRRAIEDRIELLAAAADGGAELATTLPVSIRRALGIALAAAGRVEAAVDMLEEAETRWRTHQGYTEVAEVLLVAAALNAGAGRRAVAARQASEAYVLAERLGMPSVRTRALRLHHAEHANGLDLGQDDERMILMSDVVGSTAVGNEQGDNAYFELVMEHHRLVREALDDHGGVEFSEGGDSLLAWFESPEEAIECALAIQSRAGTAHRRGSPLRLRVSVAGGKPFFREGRPYGSAVNLAALLSGEAEPGQVIVDESTLVRMSPVVAGFSTERRALRSFGLQTVGILGGR